MTGDDLPMAGSFVTDPSRRRTPHLEIIEMALDEYHRLVTAIFVEHALGSPAPAV